MGFFVGVVLAVLVSTVFSCTREEVPEETGREKLVSVLFSPGGLGDQGYNDLILAGFQKVRKECGDIDMVFYTPDSVGQAERIVREWLHASSPYRDEIFVLASSDYEYMLRNVLRDECPDGTVPPEKDMLLFESVNIYSLPVRTLRISTFGASYLAGVSAAAYYGDRPALAVSANQTDRAVLSAVDGFVAGWRHTTSVPVDTVCMAADWTGFVQSEKAYRKMHEWSKVYGFVFPVAGGTNNGIYKYLRENPESMKTAGMDVNQFYLCSDIIGSVLKHIDILIYDSIMEWIGTGDIAASDFYGLEDGYSEWFCPLNVGAGIKEKAIMEEKAYENR